MSETQSTAEINTEQNLRTKLTDFEQRYQPERLQGLSVRALEHKHERACKEAAGILDSFPPESGLTGPWRAIAHDDLDESLAALTNQQQTEVIHTLERCIDNIERERTERRDNLRAERWEQINKTLQSVGQTISLLVKLLPPRFLP